MAPMEYILNGNSIMAPMEYNTMGYSHNNGKDMVLSKIVFRSGNGHGKR